MKCHICGQEVDNSEELAKHIEKMHALAETAEPEQVNKPDLPAEEEVPEPTPMPGRI